MPEPDPLTSTARITTVTVPGGRLHKATVESETGFFESLGHTPEEAIANAVRFARKREAFLRERFERTRHRP